MTKVIPENYLKWISEGDRKSLGKAGRTWKECIAKGEAKNERELQGQIVNLLRLRGIEPLWHRTDRRSAATIGWPDITFAYYGKAIAWEVKLPNGRLSREQDQMLDTLGTVPNWWDIRVIRSVDQALGELHRIQTETT
jgi:hypothetical protein